MATFVVVAGFQPGEAAAVPAPPQEGWAATPTEEEQELIYPAVFGGAGSLQVSPAMGAVSDQLPIVVPPGRRGVEPKLSLVYNSLGGSGEAGLGWSIAGLGFVEPSRRDGVPSVGRPEAYQFSLAGLGGELRDVGGGVFRAEEEQVYREFRRVAGGGWEMRDGSGARTYFGTTPETRLLDDRGEVQRWLVDRAEDPSGNTITFGYLDSGGTKYIQEIRYTGHRPSGDPGANRLVFEYESRDDERISYRAATREERSLRLARITVSAGDSLVRRYEFGYGSHPLNHQSLLEELTLVGADDESRVTLRTLEYSTRSLGWSATGSGLPFDLADAEGNDTGTRVADVNGDGYADMISDDAEVHLGDGSGAFERDDGWTASAQDFLAASRRGGYPWTSARLFTVTVDGESGDSGVRIQDVNGDGLPDLLFARTLWTLQPFPGHDRLVWLNNGAGWQPSTQWTDSLGAAKDPYAWGWPGPRQTEPVSFVDCGAVTDFGETQSIPAWRGVELVDANGDGLVDIVWAERNSQVEKYAPCTYSADDEYDHASVFLNTGTGWTRDEELSDALRDLWQPDASWFVVDGQLQGASMGDVNGDGMADVVRALEGQPKEVFLADGHGWSRDAIFSDSLSPTAIATLGCDDDPCERGSERTATGLVPADFDDDGLLDYLVAEEGEPPLAYHNTGSGWEPAPEMARQLDELGLAFIDADGKRTGTTLADLDGDGIADFVRGRDGQRSAWVSAALRAGLLERSTSTLGEVSELAWLPSTHFDNRRTDGVQGLPMAMPLAVRLTRHDGLGHEAVTSIDYTGGLFSGRRFRGFRHTSETSPTGFRREREHHQDDGLVGLVWEERGIDTGGDLQSRAVSVFDRSMAAGILQTRLRSTQQSVFDSGGSHTTQVDYEYDDRLNATSILRDQDVLAGGDETRATTTFVRDDGAAVWSLPVRTVVTDFGGQRVADQTNLYDGLPEGAVSRGLPTEVREWVDDSTTASRRLLYDERGVLVEEVDQRGGRTRYGYDPTGTYRTWAVDPGGLEVRSAYDPRFGVLASDRDPGGNVETRSYDAFGRLARIDLPGDKATPAGTRTYDYGAVGAPTSQSYRVQAWSADGASEPAGTTYLFDGMGKVYRTESTGPAGETVVTTTEYDASGNAVSRSRPHLAGDAGAATTFRYDDQHRVVEAVEPDGTSMTIAYRGTAVDVTGPRGSTTTYDKNADGDVVAVHEWVEGREQVTRFDYDAGGRVIGVTDAMGSETRVGYDGLGNRVSLQDPNVGTYTYEYDGDLLVAMTSPDGAIMRLFYDAAGNLVREELPGGEVHRFAYGGPGSGNASGRLVRVEDSTGSVDIAYDARGNTISRRRVLGSREYVTAYAYDGLDRMISTRYPDDYRVEYDYGAGGGLSRVTDSTGREVVSGLRYDAAGQLEEMQFANGVRSAFSYDDLQRMTTLVATAGDGAVVQDLGYQYDSANNVSGIVDGVTGDSQAFEYDELDRLTRAVGSAYGDRRYAYDAIGNLLRKGDLVYGVDPAHPQRVSCVVDSVQDPAGAGLVTATGCPDADPNPAMVSSPMAVLYDGRGNVVQKGGQRYEYDDENQLVRTLDAGGAVVEANTYDATGELVAKRTGDVSTTYIDGIYEEIRGPDTAVARHHVYAGPLLVATFETASVGPESTTPEAPLATPPAATPGSAPGSLPRTGSPVAALIALAGALLAVGGVALWAANGRRAAGQIAAGPGPSRGRRRRAVVAVVLGLGLLAHGLTSDAGQAPVPGSTSTPTGAAVSGVDVPPGTTVTTAEDGATIIERDFYYHANHLGSVDAITDASGAVVERRAFEPYGEHVGWNGPADSPSGQRAGFGGQAEDVTGLVDFGARQYDAQLGRFLTPDTMVSDPTDPRTLNRYAFAGGNPIRYIDPTGHEWWDWLIGAVVLLAVVTFALLATVATGGSIWLAVGIIGGLALVGATVGGLVGYYGLGLRGGDLAGAIFTGFFIGAVIGAGIVAFPITWGSSAGFLLGMAADAVLGVAIGSIEQVVVHFGWGGGGPMELSDFFNAWIVGAVAGAALGGVSRGLSSLGGLIFRSNLAKFYGLPRLFLKASRGGQYLMPGGAVGAYKGVEYSAGHYLHFGLPRLLRLSRVAPVRPGVPLFGEGNVVPGPLASPLTWGTVALKGVLWGVDWLVRSLRGAFAGWSPGIPR